MTDIAADQRISGDYKCLDKNSNKFDQAMRTELNMEEEMSHDTATMPDDTVMEHVVYRGDFAKGRGGAAISSADVSLSNFTDTYNMKTSESLEFGEAISSHYAYLTTGTHGDSPGNDSSPTRTELSPADSHFADNERDAIDIHREQTATDLSLKAIECNSRSLAFSGREESLKDTLGSQNVSIKEEHTANGEETATDLSLKANQNECSVLNDIKPAVPHKGLATMIPISQAYNFQMHSESKTSRSRDSSSSKMKSCKSGTKKSFVWNYFRHPELDGVPDRSRTQCLLCDSQLAFNASGTTTTMLNHLKSRHNEVAEQEEIKRRQARINAVAMDAGENKFGIPGKTHIIKKDHLDGDVAVTPSAGTGFHKSPGGSARFSTGSRQGGLLNGPCGPKKKKPVDSLELFRDNSRMQEPNRGAQLDRLFSDILVPRSNYSLNGKSPPHLSHPVISGVAGSIPPNVRTPLNVLASGSVQPIPSEQSRFSADDPNQLFDNTLRFSSFLPTNATQAVSHLPNQGSEAGSPINILTNPATCSDLKSQSTTKRKRKPTHYVLETLQKRRYTSESNPPEIEAPNKLTEENSEGGWSKKQYENGANMTSDVNAFLPAVTSSCNSLTVPVSDSTESDVAEKLAYFLIRDLYPIDILAGEGFKYFVRSLAPGAQLPTVKQMRNLVLPDLKRRTESSMLQEFQREKIRDVSLSVEMWENEGRHYASVQFHYLNTEMKHLNSRLLKTSEISVQKLCSSLLLTCFNTLQLPDSSPALACPVVVNNPEPLTDELNNPDIVEDSHPFLVIPCLVSCLSEAIKTGFSLTKVAEVISKCRNLRQSLAASLSQVELVTEERGSCGNGSGAGEGTPSGGIGAQAGVGSGAVSSGESWQQAHALLSWASKCHPTLVDQYRGTASYDGILLTVDEEALLRELIPVVECINQTMDLIQMPGINLTASMIKPILSNLSRNYFAECSGSGQTSDPSTATYQSSSPTDVVRRFKEAVWCRLCQFYPDMGPVSDALHIATLVDPRFKSKAMENHRAVQMLKDLIEESTTSTRKAEAESFAPHEGSLQTVFGAEYFSQFSSSEVDRYLREESIHPGEDPFLWWAERRTKFPRITQQARRYLCVPLTSLAPSQLFPSRADVDSVQTRRAGLSPTDLDTYLFLLHNWTLPTATNGRMSSSSSTGSSTKTPATNPSPNSA